MFDRVVSLTHMNLDRFSLGSATWGQQFVEAMSVNGGDIENASAIDYVMHLFTFGWKVCVFGNESVQSRIGALYHRLVKHYSILMTLSLFFLCYKVDRASFCLFTAPSCSFDPFLPRLNLGSSQ